METIDEMEDDVSPLQALGLHRVGAPLPQRPNLPTPPPLNKRGMPVRIRKKNPMYFDENLVSNLRSPRGSPRKGPKSQPNSASNTPKKQKRSPPPSPSTQSNRPHSLRSHSTSNTPTKQPLAGSSSHRSSNTSSHNKIRVVRPETFIPSNDTPDSSTPSSPSFRDDSTLQADDLEPPSLFKLNLNSSLATLNSSMCSNKSLSSAIATPSLSTQKVTTPGKNKNGTVKNSPETDAHPLSEQQKESAQQNGVRLRNFLKLPQAHKWIYYEWFYANIDRPLFLGPNDFEQVMSEAFPRLKTRQLTRRQWSIVRRCMGKPRRCSQAFFTEERTSLDKRRQVLRLLQQRKITDIDQLRDLPFTLPSLIPCQLVIGTRVTARIRKPENGLYMGRIDAVDTSNNTYRITFGNGIGTHSIPDHEVLSCDPPEMMPKSSFQQKFRPRPPMGLITPPRALLPRTLSGDTPGRNSLIESFDSPNYITNDPVLAQAPRQPTNTLGLTDNIGQYSVESLMHIVQLWKLLENKADKVSQLDKLNGETELLKCNGSEITTGFQRKYATLVLDVDTLNEQLNSKILRVQSFCQEISGNIVDVACPRLLPIQIQERCMAEALAVVQVSNSATPDPVTNKDSLKLVASLTSLMLQIKNLGESDVSAFELTSLQATLNAMRNEVEDKQMFRDMIDVPLTHIMAAVSQLGPLNAFSATNS